MAPVWRSKPTAMNTFPSSSFDPTSRAAGTLRGGLWSGTPVARLQFFCPLCPYVHRPRRKRKVDVPTRKKAVEDIIGADDDGQDRTSVRCPACGHGEAFFKQLQIRSADEPMTIFYRCCDKKCGHRWNE